MTTTRLLAAVQTTHLPQYRIADAVGAQHAAFSRWCHGKAEIPTTYIISLAAYFQCNPADLLGYIDDWVIELDNA